uniref:Uncharacterized protein n=1 Tax=Panagrolaimus sp. JU765 TaxID=591449 RepID=A0AC34R5C1_9BILA
MIEVEPPVLLTVTSPKQPQASLTPDFVEVRAQRFSKELDDGIVDRKLPPIPANSLKTQHDEKIDPGQLYLQIRNNLKEVYTGKTRETSLSEEQFNTLEANRRRLEIEKQQLREMGII